MPYRIEVDGPENHWVETGIGQAYLVKLRVGEELHLGILLVVDAEPHDGHASEEDVIGVVEVDVVDWSAGEQAQVTVEEDGHHVNYIFVEHVED